MRGRRFDWLPAAACFCGLRAADLASAFILHLDRNPKQRNAFGTGGAGHLTPTREHFVLQGNARRLKHCFQGRQKLLRGLIRGKVVGALSAANPNLERALPCGSKRTRTFWGYERRSIPYKFMLDVASGYAVLALIEAC